MTYDDVFLPVAKEAGMTPERLGAWNGLVRAYIRGLLEAQREACTARPAIVTDAFREFVRQTPLVEIK